MIPPILTLRMGEGEGIHVWENSLLSNQPLSACPGQGGNQAAQQTAAAQSEQDIGWSEPGSGGVSTSCHAGQEGTGLPQGHLIEQGAEKIESGLFSQPGQQKPAQYR